MTRVCLQCDTAIKNEKYCSLDCHVAHKNLLMKTRIENGELVSVIPLKKYLLSLNPFCSECPTGQEWNGKRLVLHLDHIDGDSDNNALSNLRLLCPNCHSQTPTYCSRRLTNSYSKRSVRLNRAPSRNKARVAQRQSV